MDDFYTGICTIVERRPYKKDNKSTSFREVIVLQDQPCNVSFSSSQTAKNDDNANSISQSVKLFISPSIVIAAGSKITVTQNGIITSYTNSGEPAIYSTHQEIMLRLFERWA